MLMAFQEHIIVTDGGLLLKGTACHVMLFSGMVVWTGWVGTKMLDSSANLSAFWVEVPKTCSRVL